MLVQNTFLDRPPAAYNIELRPALTSHSLALLEVFLISPDTHSKLSRERTYFLSNGVHNITGYTDLGYVRVGTDAHCRPDVSLRHQPHIVAKS